ncbi:hypothetical protein SAMN05421810_10586 [Amycolatopsis arida]|uniref:DUF2332 domain-containing protein n=1 Tax=Amycolatopsis arida TaxID=587909 RepID=A0A1I5WG24_9PSEU|nr:DUF2332 domain-containing protein [Amycolatopsis arida]TDX92260.1 hypothetical protein CLV69_105105 [Amycolatopsis arida]SFQ18559.1 hypothetical protein SAMN05421810_10586 [Amycolatopsis arida]
MSDLLAEIRHRLREFASTEAAGASPLYEHLAERAAEDDAVASLLAAAPPADARPTLLLAAAHRLVQAEPAHPLSRYYPSLGGSDGVDGQTWPLFRAFLLERADKVRELVSTRFTQTNEVRRAALLYPAVSLAARQAGGRVALLEVGCSAGLLLGLDRFNYRYHCPGGEQLVAGPAKAAVGLHCALEVAGGAAPPKLPKKLSVGARLGLDRAPVDAGDEEELAWLEACVWADQPERIRLLRTAALAQRKDPPELVAGDAVDDLAAAAGRLPAELPLLVITSHVLPYLPERRRVEFVGALRDLAVRRPLWWISDEGYEAAMAHVLPGRDDLALARTGRSVLGLATWVDGELRAQVLARTSSHGQRMTWVP